VADDRADWKGKPRHGGGMPGWEGKHLGSNSRLSQPHISKCAAHFLMSSSSVLGLTSGAVMRVFLGTSLLNIITWTSHAHHMIIHDVMYVVWPLHCQHSEIAGVSHSMHIAQHSILPCKELSPLHGAIQQHEYARKLV